MTKIIVATFTLLGLMFELSVGEIDSSILQRSKKENRFVSMGCWGGEKNSKRRQKEVADQMKDLVKKYDVSYSIAAGDNFYRKGIGSVDDPRWDDGWGNLYPKIPFLAALGNHDYRGNIWAQVNKTFTDSNQLAPNQPRWNLPYPYYEKIMGDVHWFILDTVLLERCEVNPRGTKLWHDRCWDKYKQLEWLSEKLSSSDSDWKIVVGHFPMFANGPHVNHPWLRKILCPLFEEHGVSMYINADNHYLQYSLHNDIWYVNAGGGAGYMKHTAKDKGFKMDETNIWHHFGDGLFFHVIVDDRMFVHAVGPDGTFLTKFEVKARKSAPKAILSHSNSQKLDTVVKATLPDVSSAPVRQLDPTTPPQPVDSAHLSIVLVLPVAVIAAILAIKKFRFGTWSKQHSN